MHTSPQKIADSAQSGGQMQYCVSEGLERADKDKQAGIQQSNDTAAMKAENKGHPAGPY